MSQAAKSPCRQSGCRALLDRPGYCDQHRKAAFKAQKAVVDDSYKERNRFYQRKAWKDARAERLRIEPMCRFCRRNGRLVAAEIVDHIVAITDGGHKSDQGNLQSLCKSCHNAKTRRNDCISTGAG